MYHLKSFLAGLGVGRELKGWGGSGAGAALPPLCWNDPGVYDCFYIDYRYGLQHVSFGRFRNQTVILGSGGEITPTEVEAVDRHTVRVWADLTGQVQLRLFGNGKPGLSYTDGRTVGPFSADLWIDGAAPCELPYMAESVEAAAVLLAAEEHARVAAAEAAERIWADTAAYTVRALEGSEAASISYT